MTVYGLYMRNPQEIAMIASSAGSANTMRTMFGAARWRARKLTAAEIATPEVQAEIATLKEAGVWE